MPYLKQKTRASPTAWNNRLEWKGGWKELYLRAAWGYSLYKALCPCSWDKADSFAVRTWAELPLAKQVNLCYIPKPPVSCPYHLILNRGQQRLCTDNCDKVEEWIKKDKGKKYLPSRWIYKSKFITHEEN